MQQVRHVVIVLGDQLDESSSAFDGFDPTRDLVFMAEVAEESTHVWSHKARIVLFLSAMRHFRNVLTKRGWTVRYLTLKETGKNGSLAACLIETIQTCHPEKIILTEPGDWRVEQQLVKASKDADAELEIRSDRHFLCSKQEFVAHAKGRRQLRMEFFYREMRQKTGVLMEQGKPVLERWNFDAENRGSFSRTGPGTLPPPRRFIPDQITRDVIALVEERFPDHPGDLKHFDWPLTSTQARQALDDFISNRLPDFGRYQDAMWTGEPFLYHSRISAALNLKLLNPREVIEAAEQAWKNKQAGIEAVEGFIRQILGWREYVRGIYWLNMPKYGQLNALDANEPLPGFYWTGHTEMNCLRQAITQTLTYGYAHHIQRLMVTGLFALLLGVRPQAVHEWYLAVYVDAVEWVELPNTLGMSQYGDNGLMASKPYIATGKYIQRMSNYCAGCQFNPANATGSDACPFTTLYWDFLMRHENLLKRNQRMSLQVRNLMRLATKEKLTIAQKADDIRTECRAAR